MIYRGLSIKFKGETGRDPLELNLSEVTFTQRATGGLNSFHLELAYENGSPLWRLQLVGSFFAELATIGSLWFGSSGSTESFHTYGPEGDHLDDEPIQIVASARSDISFLTLEEPTPGRWRLIASQSFFGDVDEICDIEIIRND